MRAPEAIRLEHYLAISRAIGGELDFQKVLNRIAGAVKSKLLDYDHMDVAVILPNDKSMHIAIETGVKTFWGQNGKHQQNALSPIRQMLNGEVDVLTTGDAWEDSRFHFDGSFDAPIFEANLRSRIHVSLNVHGELLGALNISSHSKNAYTAQDVDTARNIADLISPYIYALNMSEQARLAALAEGAARGREQSLRVGAQKLTEAMEAERQRLGMELHDQTLADLSAIYHRVEKLSDDSHPKAQELRQVSAAISRCTRELRGIIENAKPGVLDLFGLTQAIEAQLKRSTQGLDREIATDVTDTTADFLDQGAYRIRLAVFRIVQEAVTNAVKHSECHRISVALSRQDAAIRITVTNDGIEPPEGWRRSNRGVNNVRVRAALIGADIAFERTPENVGSQTILTIPLSVFDDQNADDPEGDLSARMRHLAGANENPSRLEDTG
ncbi:GAF domain-containing sensor histidine kinase [Roseobacter sp. EG26]|uniref:GAF domain-containing sensor histidine kinase n=1 Tax=Roseobacter sp. EG26 TaxID=3412477 RepID=UPI003CE56D67